MEIDVRTPDLVVVGIDGSQHSRAALAWAAEEAQAQGRRLCVFHCWKSMPLSAALPGVFPAPNAWHARNVARAAVEEAIVWLHARFPALPITGTVLEGSAGHRLVSHVRRGDLLVLGLTSRHRFTARLLGSTVEYALQHARGTVVVVPAEDADHGRHDGGMFSQHVVAAVDGSEATSAVLGTAFAEAAVHGWPLAVVHIDRHDHEPNGPVDDESVVNGAVESWRARHPQVVVRRATLHGPTAVVLDQVAAGARLLVVGRSSHPLRPVRLTDLLLARVHCPVAVTPPLVDRGRWDDEHAAVLAPPLA